MSQQNLEPRTSCVRGGSTILDCDWQLFHFTHFINPRRHYWDKSSVLNWGLTTSSCCNLMEKQSKGGWLCIWGISSPFICSYVSSQICSLWFATLLSEALQMLQVCSSWRFSDQVSATSCFGLLQNHKRGSRFFFNSQASWFTWAHTFLDLRVEVACLKPQSCCSPLSSLPQLLAFSLAVSIINQAVLKDRVCAN